ncbi:MAG TPA: hypothetical protein DCL21_01610 [Alphaproteobacteria bacterium]|nr:hypothetical protein [Alphaproteobacteria bacterium]
MTFTTTANIAQVRAFSGSPTTLTSDETIKLIMNNLTEEFREKYKINFEPVKTIEISNGHNSLGYTVKKRFPLKILELKIYNEIVDVDKIHLDWASGTITMQSDIGSNSTKFSLFPSQNNSVKIKYLNAWMDKSDFVAESTLPTLVGMNVEMTLDDVTGLNIDDWVWIEGMDRRAEVAKVTDVNTVTKVIKLDKLSQTHEEGSIITRLKHSKLLGDYIMYESAIAIANNAVGATYTLNTGYSLGSLNTQKGVPYTHWRDNRDFNVKKAQDLKKLINLKLMVVG